MLRKILIAGGIDGRPRCLDWLRFAVDRRKPDALLFVGGVLDQSRHYCPRITPWDMSSEDAHFVQRFFRVLGEMGIFTAVIPGPVDTPTEDFLRLGMQAELEFPHIHLAHASMVEKVNLMVSGLGGDLFESLINGKDSGTRTMAEYHLRSLWTAVKPDKVLLFSAPPPGPLGGEEAKKLVGDLIDTFHPRLAAVAGLHNCRGSQRIAHTLVVNPGHLAEGSALWLDWSRPADEQLEHLDLRHMYQVPAPADMGSGD